MKITLISPRLALQKGDFLGSGVPYWPVELATFAAYLKAHSEEVDVIDLFGSDPSVLTENDSYYLQGLPIESFLGNSKLNADLFVIYAISYMSHQEIQAIVRYLKELRADNKIAILENSQAVTAYSVSHVRADFWEAGADYALIGEMYHNWPDVKAFIQGSGPQPKNVLARTNAPERPYERYLNRDISTLPPSWELFNLKNYWRLPYSHGPKTARFLPILTSRGCPYPCDFCVVPEMNARKWRGRKAAEIVDEIIYLRDKFNVRDFQIEDLNPTVDVKRMDEICDLLITRDVGIRFYIVSGTKAETVKTAQIKKYAQAGCRYISISPESGSAKVMKAIGKPFDYEHGLDLVIECNKYGIKTQACFIIGHPAETDEDHLKSVAYLKQLLSAGLDEAAFFIIAPFAGSDLFQKQEIEMTDRHALVSFSPKGRANWEILERRRKELLKAFFIGKIKKGPDLVVQTFRSLFGVPATKMENLPLRVGYVMWLMAKNKFLRPKRGVPVHG